MERMWPKHAGNPEPHGLGTNAGIRYKYGDTWDVIKHLAKGALHQLALHPSVPPALLRPGLLIVRHILKHLRGVYHVNICHRCVRCPI